MSRHGDRSPRAWVVSRPHACPGCVHAGCVAATPIRFPNRETARRRHRHGHHRHRHPPAPTSSSPTTTSPPSSRRSARARHRRRHPRRTSGGVVWCGVLSKIIIPAVLARRSPPRSPPSALGRGPGITRGVRAHGSGDRPPLGHVGSALPRRHSRTARTPRSQKAAGPRFPTRSNSTDVPSGQSRITADPQLRR